MTGDEIITGASSYLSDKPGMWLVAHVEDVDGKAHFLIESNMTVTAVRVLSERLAVRCEEATLAAWLQGGQA
jgi:hypothetical protein